MTGKIRRRYAYDLYVRLYDLRLIRFRSPPIDIMYITSRYFRYWLFQLEYIAITSLVKLFVTCLSEQALVLTKVTAVEAARECMDKSVFHIHCTSVKKYGRT